MNTEPEPTQDNDLKRIENRLRTFNNWPLQFIQPTELARAGNEYKILFCNNFLIFA